MKQFLEYVVPNLVTHPEDVSISEETKEGVIHLMIKVNAEDVGRVIGRSGKIIKSLRQLVRVMAIKQGVRVNVDVEDSQNNLQMPEDSSAEAAEEIAAVETETPAEEELMVPQESELAPVEEEGKIKQIIDFIVRNAVDPRTDRPYTSERIERSLDEAGVNITNKPIESQINEIIDDTNEIMPDQDISSNATGRMVGAGHTMDLEKIFKRSMTPSVRNYSGNLGLGTVVW